MSESIDVRLARMEEKLDILLVPLKKTVDEDHENRLSSLERWRSYLAGAALVISAAIGWIFKH